MDKIQLIQVNYLRSEVTFKFFLPLETIVKALYLHNVETNELINIKKVERLTDRFLEAKFNIIIGPEDKGILSTGVWRFIFVNDDLEQNLEHPHTIAIADSSIFSQALEIENKVELEQYILPELTDKTPAGKNVITTNRKQFIASQGPLMVRLGDFSHLYYKNKTNFYDFNLVGNIQTNEINITIIYKQPAPAPSWGTKQKKKIKKFSTKLKAKILSPVQKLNDPIYKSIFSFSQKFIKIKKNRVLFTSDSRATIGGNLEFVHKRMLERGLDYEYDIQLLFKPSIHAKRPLKDKFLLPYYLATSKTIFIDDYHPMLYKLKYSKSQEIIQLWHASGPFKTVGYSRLGKPGGPTLNSNSHKIYTKAITSSDYAIPFYAEAFGIPENCVIPTGIPRVDPFFSDEYITNTITRMQTEIPAIKNASKVILFSPTFRGVGPSNAFYPSRAKLNLVAMAEYARKHNAIFLIKLHPFVLKNIQIPDEFKDVLIDVFDYREINDLLFVTDLLITDYSSVVFEYSIFEKPILFYAYDLEEYIESRDFYVNFEDFVPGKIVKTFDDMMLAIEQNDFEIEKIKDFKNLYFKYQDAHSTDRVIDQLILEKDGSETYVYDGITS